MALNKHFRAMFSLKDQSSNAEGIYKTMALNKCFRSSDTSELLQPGDDRWRLFSSGPTETQEFR